MASFVDRMIGAAKLDVATYEEVEADTSAMGQAMLVVVLSAVAGALGISGQMGGFRSFLPMAVAGLLGWYLWAFLTWLVGTKILATPETNADMGQLLRTIGFSASPGILRALGAIPVLGPLIALVAGVWMLIAMSIAVRQALDYRSTGRALAVCVIGFCVYLGFLAAIAAMLGLGAGFLSGFGSAPS
jgi:hypothetical protein